MLRLRAATSAARQIQSAAQASRQRCRRVLVAAVFVGVYGVWTLDATPNNAPTTIANNRKTRAMDVALRGKVAAAAQQWSRAARLFLRAFELDHDRGYLYSAGRCYEGAGDHPEARRLYRRVIALPAANDRLPHHPDFGAKAKARLANLPSHPPLRRTHGASDTGPLPLTTQRPPGAPPSPALPARSEKVAVRVARVSSAENPLLTQRQAGLIALSGGIATLAGAGLILWAELDWRDYEALRDPDGRFHTLGFEAAQRRIDTINRRLIAGWVVGATGVLAASAAGAAWFRTARSVGDSASARQSGRAGSTIGPMVGLAPHGGPLCGVRGQF